MYPSVFSRLSTRGEIGALTLKVANYRLRSR
jgi:hypothetical protein